MSQSPREPAWHSRGSGLAIPCIVSARNVRVPDSFSVVAAAGWTLGMLLYLEHAGEGAVQRELLWLSAVVRSAEGGYVAASGVGPMYYVAQVYRDRAGSPWGGRDRPTHKKLAHFSRFGNRVTVDAEDGTHMAFSFKPRGLTFRAPASITTVQRSEGRVVCFKARARTEVQLSTYRIEAFESESEPWVSFKSGLVLPGVASHVRSFEAKLSERSEVRGRLDSIAPAPSLV